MSVFSAYSRICAVWALLLLLGGCASVGTESALPADWMARKCYDNIEIGGRFSVRYGLDGREQAAHGGFQWRQSGQHLTLALLSPVGQTMAVIETRPSLAMLTLAGERPRVAADVDALAAEALGWPLPVSGLRDWLQACSRAAGSRPTLAPDSNEWLTDDGWRLAYPAWEPDAAGGASRPKRIDLQRTVAGGEVVLRLVIDNWQVP